ncbi:hypothetical protein PCANB_000497 [Pneumocystis canis]|nr:hypothetical protein PCANB_000497 [Pneumocystis canis]
MSQSRICAVIGATGTGKSRLAMALARSLNGEIINSDVMQIYHGMDILTNKPQMVERQEVPHHLLGIIDRNDSYTINHLHTQQRLPILTGGTHYYTQAILFKDTLLMEPITLNNIKNEYIINDDIKDTIKNTDKNMIKNEVESKIKNISYLSTEELFKHLYNIDPIIAKRWHPNDRRKIQHCLEIYYSTGQKPSQLYHMQHINHSHARHRLKTCIFWVYCHYKTLDELLNQRVEEMYKTGLLNEIQILYNEWILQNKTQGELHGIWQAIGFKAFLPYLELPENADPSIKQTYLLHALSEMKLATRRYARKQVKWIRNKLYPLCQEAGSDVRFYLLDATNPEQWETHVQNLAIKLATDFLNDKPACDPLSLNETAAILLAPKPIPNYASQTDLWKHYVCHVCKTSSNKPLVAVGLIQWTIHIQGRRHRKMLAKHSQQISSGIIFQ